MVDLSRSGARVMGASGLRTGEKGTLVLERRGISLDFEVVEAMEGQVQLRLDAAAAGLAWERMLSQIVTRRAA